MLKEHFETVWSPLFYSEGSFINLFNVAASLPGSGFSSKYSLRSGNLKINLKIWAVKTRGWHSTTICLISHKTKLQVQINVANAGNNDHWTYLVFAFSISHIELLYYCFRWWKIRLFVFVHLILLCVVPLVENDRTCLYFSVRNYEIILLNLIDYFHKCLFTSSLLFIFVVLSCWESLTY